MAKSFGPKANWGITVEAIGDQLFVLPMTVAEAIKTRNADGSTTIRQTGTLRPLLHRVVVNTMNMVAMSAQEAIVERMGKDFIIRNKSFKGRFPSFIQNQVKITKWAYAKDFPDADVHLTVDTKPTESNRDGTPLILNLLGRGGLRRPFIGIGLAKNLLSSTTGYTNSTCACYWSRTRTASAARCSKP